VCARRSAGASTPHDLVVDAEGMTDVDSAGLDALGDLCDGPARDGVTMRVARMKTPVRHRLEVAGIAARIGSERFHPTVRAAVRASVDGERKSPGPDDARCCRLTEALGPRCASAGDPATAVEGEQRWRLDPFS
jgi:hypothetical protein